MAQNKDQDEKIELMTLYLDDGSELECEILAVFPAAGNDYIALLPTNPPEGYESDEALIYRYVENGDDYELLSIEDDDEFEKAADAFDELLDEMEFNDMD